MHLTPEQLKIGKENFSAALGSEHLRRDFLHESNSKKLASGAGLGPYYYGYDAKLDEPLRVAVLGTGDEGGILIGAINTDFIRVTAIADIRPFNIHRAFHGDHSNDDILKLRCGLMTKYGWSTEDEARRHVNVYGDYRDLLKEEKNIEGVIIALPLHLHAPAAIVAMRDGYHVLTEKLMGHGVHECKEMARVAEETKLLLATGHQRHYNILYANAVAAIAAGCLGDLHYIQAQWHRGNLPGNDSWRQPMPEKVKPEDEHAKDLLNKLNSWKRRLEEAKKIDKDAEVWAKRVAQIEKQIEDEIVDAAKHGYEAREIKDAEGKVVYRVPPMEELIRWRLWDRTGGGLMAELGSHQLDAASIFIAAAHGGEKQYPISVAAAANRPLFPPDRDVDDHISCLYEFPAPGYDPEHCVDKLKRITVAYASINGNGFGGYGETVCGTKGTLILEKEKEAMLYRTSHVESKIKLQKEKDGALDLVLDDDGDELSQAIGTQAFRGDISRGYTEEMEHWAWCVRNPDPKNLPHCHPKVALGDAVIALTTNIAAAEGRRILFKKEWFDIHSDETPEGVAPDVSRYA